MVGRWGGGHDYIAIAINIPTVFAEIVNFANNNVFMCVVFAKKFAILFVTIRSLFKQTNQTNA